MTFRENDEYQCSHKIVIHRLIAGKKIAIVKINKVQMLAHARER